MESELNNKKKKVYINKSENLIKDELDLIIPNPNKTIINNKNELYLFSPEVLSFENIVNSNKKSILLHTLVVIRQYSITSLNGISELINLRELWVVECPILEDVSDLRECRKLEKLYLYSNNISQVPNLSNCTELNILSLNGNNISHLQNFHTMPNLKELYIANNKIKNIGNDFWQNNHLSFINFAANPLYKLKDIQNLSFLTSLRSIVFADSMYGECPLVSLSNYRYFFINYLSSLIELDYYAITNEERAHVAGFFKSKMMFYNMLRKNYANDFTKLCKDRLEESRKRISEYRKELYFVKLEQLRIVASKDIGERSKELSCQAEILQQIYYRIDANDASNKRWIDTWRINLQILQQKLNLKVQYCGNMDFVEYLPGVGNKLFEICQDMCNDSLCRIVKEDLGITRIKIHRVTKVINNETDTFRSSSYHSESILSEDQRESDSVFKFLVSPVGVVELQKWPFDIFEREFFNATDIIASDCLAAADAELMKKISSEQKSSQTASCSFSEHRLAVLIQLPVSEPTVKVEISDNYHATHLSYDKNTCQCFRIIKPEQVKPIFVLEYEYIFHNESENEDIRLSEKFRTKLVTKNSLKTSWPHLNFENLGSCLNLTEVEIIHKLRVINLSGQGIRAIDMETTSLPNLRELNLSFNKLTVFPNSAILKYVIKLDVSFNDIQSIEITTRLPLLESLNAGWNFAVKFLTVLQMLKIFTPNLTILDLKHNPFTDVTEIESMFLLARDFMPLLKSFNEKIMKNFIHSRSVNRYPWIIDSFEKSDSTKLKSTRNLTTNFISKINESLNSPLIFHDDEELKTVQYLNLSNNHLSAIEFVKEFSQLVELYLENNLFLKIFVEKPLNKLTKLDLSDNFIITLDGLTQKNLPVLNYLDLGNNLITSLISMGNFNTLTEFYCSHNDIRKLQEINNLKNWHGLKIVDISNNPIDSISLCNKFIIFHIPNIEYVGGECVTPSDILEANHTFGGSLDKDKIMNMCSLSDFTHLKQLSVVNCALKKVNLAADILPNLKSLDLSHNEITTLWGLHTLKELQVLCLSHNQVETSVENFQKDFITTECLFPSLNSLFLDYNGIRSLVDLNLQNMPVLKYLYLQHNELQDVQGLQKCANLETLVLDNNKIQIITEADFHTENNIKTLFLENNRIKYFSFMKRLSKINKLFISNNKVANEDQLKYLEKLENLKEITILGNPLCKRTNHYKLVTQALGTITRIDGHSMILKEYFDTQ